MHADGCDNAVFEGNIVNLRPGFQLVSAFAITPEIPKSLIMSLMHRSAISAMDSFRLAIPRTADVPAERRVDHRIWVESTDMGKDMGTDAGTTGMGTKKDSGSSFDQENEKEPDAAGKADLGLNDEDGCSCGQSGLYSFP